MLLVAALLVSLGLVVEQTAWCCSLLLPLAAKCGEPLLLIRWRVMWIAAAKGVSWAEGSSSGTVLLVESNCSTGCPTKEVVIAEPSCCLQKQAKGQSLQRCSSRGRRCVSSYLLARWLHANLTLRCCRSPRRLCSPHGALGASMTPVRSYLDAVRPLTALFQRIKFARLRDGDMDTKLPACMSQASLRDVANASAVWLRFCCCRKCWCHLAVRCCR